MHITTHPTVVEAAIQLLLDYNNQLVIGDSSGNGQYGHTGKALQKSGMTALADKYNVEVLSFDKHNSYLFKNDKNHYLKEVNLTGIINEVQYIVNLPKLKSHMLMGITGAVKNFFGCVPGAGKLTCHINASTPGQFAELLIDVYHFIKPKVLFNIMDAVYGIEGAGPGPAGKIVHCGFLGVSRDAIALDIACVEALGKKSENIFTIKAGINRGYSDGKIAKNQEMPSLSFKMPNPGFLAGVLHKFFPRLGMSKPFVLTEKCRKCGLCAKACPGKAITIQNFPFFDYSRCIYCYCCHENCPEAAIGLKETLLLKLFKYFQK